MKINTIKHETDFFTPFFFHLSNDRSVMKVQISFWKAQGMWHNSNEKCHAQQQAKMHTVGEKNLKLTHARKKFHKLLMKTTSLNVSGTEQALRDICRSAISLSQNRWDNWNSSYVVFFLGDAPQAFAICIHKYCASHIQVTKKRN